VGNQPAKSRRAHSVGVTCR